MVSTFLGHLTPENKLELHHCETDLAIEGYLVGPLPFWLPVHVIGLPQPLVVHRSRSVQPTDSVQHHNLKLIKRKLYLGLNIGLKFDLLLFEISKFNLLILKLQSLIWNCLKFLSLFCYFWNYMVLFVTPLYLYDSKGNFLNQKKNSMLKSFWGKKKP